MSNRFVVVGDGRRLPVIGIGDVILKAFDGHSYINTTLNSVLCVPDLKVNLFSVPSITNKGFKVTLLDEKCFVYKGNELRAVGSREGNFYVMDFIFEDNLAVASVQVWHERLCHQNYKHVKEVLNTNNIMFKGDNVTTCEACLEGKIHRLPFKNSESVTHSPLELIHADVCGPMEVDSIRGSRYFLLVKDDYTNYRQAYFMAQKSEAVQKMKIFVAAAEKSTGFVVKKIRTDNGGESVNKGMKEFVESKGIAHETTIPYTPEQNGRAEREMRTLVEAARSMLSAKKLPKELWAEAINMVVYVLNRTSKARGKCETPYQLWEGKDFDINKLTAVFGSEVYVHIPKQKRLKWDAKGEKGLFVGYEDSKGYRIYIKNRKEILVRRDVIFLQSENCKKENSEEKNRETIIWLDNLYNEGWVPDTQLQVPGDQREEPGNQGQVPGEQRKEPGDQEEGSQGEQPGDQGEKPVDQDGISEVRCENPADQRQESMEQNEDGESSELEEQVTTRSGRVVKKPKWMTDYLFLTLEGEPKSYKEAMEREDSVRWKEAIDKEIKQLKDNDTWSLVSKVPEGKEIISSKWVLKKKKNEQNEEIYKARLVARGFEQTESLGSSHDLYAPVAQMNTFRTFMSVATKLNLKVNQMDVCGAFLNSKIDDEIYLELPEGAGLESKYCKLQKSIYGLKKSPKYWNSTINDVLLSMGFKSSDKDCCLYSKCKGGVKTFLLLYVDDILYFGNDEGECNSLCNTLCSTFKMKKMGIISKYLGMNVRQEEGVTFISQEEYLSNLLASYGMSNCKPLSLPIDKNFKFDLLKREGSESKYIENKCRELIGKLMYVVIATRPDLCAVVCILSRYQACASKLLYKLLLNVLRYIKGTLHLCLKFTNNCNDDVIGFVDSDWGGCTDRKSTTGCIFKVFGNSVVWFTRKQQSVALSSTEAEYVALSQAISEACWLKALLVDFGFNLGPIKLFEDNQSTIKMAHMSTSTSRVKHLEIRRAFVKEKLEKGIINLEYVSTSEQLGDIFTKPLGGVQFEKLRGRLFEC